VFDISVYYIVRDAGGVGAIDGKSVSLAKCIHQAPDMRSDDLALGVEYLSWDKIYVM
jgi:hypothetical protein